MADTVRPAQVIVNRSRVGSRGLELNLPVKLTSLEKLPTITSEIRSMLQSHPKVSTEDENPRCHVSQVGAASFNVAISCNLKPMVRHRGHLKIMSPLVARESLVKCLSSHNC
jgi:hypothetical protein